MCNEGIVINIPSPPLRIINRTDQKRSVSPSGFDARRARCAEVHASPLSVVSLRSCPALGAEEPRALGGASAWRHSIAKMLESGNRLEMRNNTVAKRAGFSGLTPFHLIRSIATTRAASIMTRHETRDAHQSIRNLSSTWRRHE